MKRFTCCFWRWVGGMLILWGGLFSQDYQTNYIQEFRIPHTSARDLKLSGSLFTRLTNEHNSNPEFRNRNYLSGHLTLFYSGFQESEHLQWDFDAREMVSVFHQKNDNRRRDYNANLLETGEGHRNNYLQSLNLHNFFAWYPFPAKAFIYHRLTAQFEWKKQKGKGKHFTSSPRDTIDFRNRFEKEERSLALDGMVGIGVGKVRNGSTAYLAYRIAQRLEEEQALQRPLTAAEIHRIAVMLYRYREDLVNHERAAKYFFPELYRTLVENGVLTNQRSPTFVVFKLLEVLKEPLASRFNGWRIYAGAGPFGTYFRTEMNQQVDDAPEETHTQQNRGLHALFQAGGAFFYPISNRTQLNGLVQVDFQNVDFPNQYFWQNTIQASYELTEKIDLIGIVEFYQFHHRASPPVFQELQFKQQTVERFFQNRGYRYGTPYFVPEPVPFHLFVEPNSPPRQITIPVELTFRFFIEDRITLDMGINYQYQEAVHQYVLRNWGLHSELFINII